MLGCRMRELSVRRKLNAMPAVFDGKSVLLVDDSIVRGTTMSQIVEMVRAGPTTQGEHIVVWEAEVVTPDCRGSCHHICQALYGAMMHSLCGYHASSCIRGSQSSLFLISCGLRQSLVCKPSTSRSSSNFPGGNG